MSFSRIKYDNDAYDLKLNRSVGPGDYRLFKSYNENCSKCFSYDGPKNAKSDVYTVGDSQNNTSWGSMTEVESYIMNRVNKLTDDNQLGKNDSYLKFQVNPIKQICSNTLIPEDTRFTNPIELFRSMDTTVYHYTPFLYANPQCEVQEDRIGLNSRQIIKDTFKPKPVVLYTQSDLIGPVSDNLSQICKHSV